MYANVIEDLYFEWMCNLVYGKRFSKNVSYNELLNHMHAAEFTYTIARDVNRAEDGIALRHRFAYEHPDIMDAESYLDGPCSILEMMIALALRCEENIMDDSRFGNRMGQWFWGMIVNLGLGSMTDGRYDEDRVNDILAKFVNRKYEPDGKGGLFTIKNCKRDLREVEIWYQLCWYLDNIV